VQQPHHRLTVTAISEVEVNPRALPENTGATRPWEQVRDTAIREALEEGQINRIYALDSAFVKRAPELADYAAASFPAGRPYLESVHDLMRRIYRDFTYDPHFTEIATPLDEVLKHRRGVCQDFAHLAIGCLRSLDLPARYVSGYLETLPPPGKPKLRGADASHAWFAAYVPGEGWLDFDPTNDKMPEDQHITTAVGRDFGDVTPIKGVLYGGGEHSLHVSVDVELLEQRA
jgi:transglutaminase-like putative cysteine protease